MQETNCATPASLGWHMPAEWAPHEATWLAWPKNPITFPAGILEHVEQTYAAMVGALSEGERVDIVVDDVLAEERVRGLLGTKLRSDRVRFHRFPSVDVWIRDWGPSFLLHRVSGRKACVKWRFNAWGEKYADLMADDAAGDEVVRRAGVEAFRPGVVLEGGSIDVNGAGVVLTTRQCLLNPNRNPSLSAAEVEGVLRANLGADRVVWLNSGIEGDDTDGHVDDFARFAGEKTVLCCVCQDRDDPNHPVLDENYRLLAEGLGREGFDIVPLPLPAALVDPEENRRLPASYANFYVGNAAVLLPAFDDPADGEAAAILSRAFPTRRIVQVPAAHLVFGYGGIHCVTQQEPAEVGTA